MKQEMYSMKLFVITTRNFIRYIAPSYTLQQDPIQKQQSKRLPVLEVVNRLLLPVHSRVSIILILAFQIGKLSRTSGQVHLVHVDHLCLSND
jgi:hypothetical protein